MGLSERHPLQNILNASNVNSSSKGSKKSSSKSIAIVVCCANGGISVSMDACGGVRVEHRMVQRGEVHGVEHGRVGVQKLVE